jgi:hypothetical protein
MNDTAKRDCQARTTVLIHNKLLCLQCACNVVWCGVVMVVIAALSSTAREDHVGRFE